MKKLIKSLICFSLLVVGVLFAFFLTKGEVYATDYEATNFKTIDIDEDTISTVYKMENMVGVDPLTSFGQIEYHKSSQTLIIKNVHLYQTADPLAFDDEGNRLPLIRIRNVDVEVIVEGDNEIICYGSVFELLGEDNEYEFNASRISKATENVLHIHNRTNYEGKMLPALYTDASELNIGTNSSNILTFSSTGVGGFVSGKDTIMNIDDKVNLFINAEEEKDYYEADEPDNFLNFDSGSGKVLVAIEGFKQVNTPSNSKYKFASNIVYDNSIRFSGQYIEREDKTFFASSDRFIFGNFRHVLTYDDLVYLLALKEEDQTEGYVNIILDATIHQKYFRDYLADNDGCAINVNGLKRIFLNSNYLSGEMKDSVHWGDMLSFINVRNGATLEIYGASDSKKSEESNIFFQSDEDNGEFCLICVQDKGTLRIMDNVQLKMKEDIVGVNNDYDGQILHIEGIVTIFRGILLGSDTYDDYSTAEEGWGTVLTLTLVGMVAGLPMLMSRRTKTRGVITYIPNIKRVGLRFISGTIRSYEGCVIHTYGTGEDLYPWRYYGGSIKSDDGVDLFGYGYYDNPFVETYQNMGQFPNESLIVWVDDGANYGGVVLNSDDQGYQNLYYKMPTNDAKRYDGMYQVGNCRDIIVGKSIRYIDPLYTPYLMTDLPSDIYVGDNNNQSQRFELELFKPETGEENPWDYTLGKGYEVSLFVITADGVSIWNQGSGSDSFGFEPHKSLNIRWVDDKIVLTVKPSFPAEFDGAQIFVNIQNKGANTNCSTSIATIHKVEDLQAASISITAPKDAFNSEKGYTLEMGKNNSGVKVEALVKSAYSDEIIVEWFDQTSSEAVSATQKITLANKDEDGVYYTNITFTPPTGSTKEGLHEYSLKVWVYSKYSVDSYELTYSRPVFFNVVAGTPEIISQSATSLGLIEGEYAEVSIETSDSVPNVGYKWYYYPSREKMVGIDSDSPYIDFGTLLPELYSDIAYLQGNGNKNILTLDITHLLELGETYRIRFKEAGDKEGKNVNVTLEYGDNLHNVTPILSTYKEISGLYSFEGEFSYLIVDRADMYLDPTYAKLMIEFEGNNTTTHYLEDFYLEKYDSEHDSWSIIQNLNPYHFGINYLETYPLLNDDGSQVTGKNLNYQVSLDLDGYYLYCRAYNMADPTKSAYSTPILLRVGAEAITPIFVGSEVEYHVVEEGSPLDIVRNVEVPFVNHEWVVEYTHRYYIYANKKYEALEVSKEDLFDDYGLRITEQTNPSDGSTTVRVELVNPDLASSVIDYIIGIETIAISTSDSELYDFVYDNVSWYYDDPSEEATLNVYHRDGSLYQFNGTTSKYMTSDGSFAIQDIVYFTKDARMNLVAERETIYNNYASTANYDREAGYQYEWFVKWLVDGIQEDLSIDDFLTYYSDTDDCWMGEYIIMQADYNELSVLFSDWKTIPFIARNFVVYAKITAPDGKEMYTKNYQMSYVDVYTLDSPQITVDNIYLNTTTGDVEVDFHMGTTIYNNKFYLEYDLGYKKVLAVSNEIYDIDPDIKAEGLIRVFGASYLENYYGLVGSVDEYFIANNPEFIFDDTTSPNSYAGHLVISEDKIRAYYEYRYEDKESPFIEDISLAEYYSYNIGQFDTEEELMQAIHNIFTDDEILDLQKMWYDYVSIGGTLYLNILGNRVMYYFIDPVYITMEELLMNWIPLYYDEYFGFTTNVKVVKGEDTQIGGNSPIDKNPLYKWYKMVDNDGKYEYVLLGGEEDAYLQADTSAYTENAQYYRQEIILRTADSIDAVGASYYNYFAVDVVSDVLKPTITNIDNQEAMYKDPSFMLEVEALDNNDKDSKLYYEWYLDDKLLERTDVNQLALYDFGLLDELGNHEFYVKVYAVKTYEISDGQFGSSQSELVKSETKTLTVIKREIGLVLIDDVELPIIYEHPTVGNVKAVSPISDDEFIGYKITSAYYDIDSEEFFQYDNDYTITIIVDLLDNAVWADTILARINQEFDANVTKLSDSQIRVTYDFASSESAELDKIEIEFKEFEENGILRYLDPIEREEYALTGQEWNSEDANFAYGKDYVFSLEFTIYNQYHFAASGKVIINQKEVEYEINDKVVSVDLHYYFSYKAKVVIGEEEQIVKADNENKVTLDLNEENIPDGYIFDGWYLGDTLISKDFSCEYEIADNDCVFEAKFIALNHLSNVEINFPELHVGDILVSSLQGEYVGFSIDSITWDSSDDRLKVMTNYRVEIALRLASGYVFDDGAKVTVLGSEYVLTPNGDVYVFGIDYLFGYVVTIKVLDNTDTKEVISGKLALSLPENVNPLLFDGWYSDDKLILASASGEIDVNKDMTVIARFKDAISINEVTIPENKIPQVNALDKVSKPEDYLGTNFKVEFSWLTEDANFGFNKAYTLELKVSPNANYKLENVTLKIGNKEVNYSVKDGNLIYNLEYVFKYHVQIKVLDNTNDVEASLEGKVSLSAPATSGNMHFVGWYVGETLVSDKNEDIYTVTENNILIEAKYEQDKYPSDNDNVISNYDVKEDGNDITDVINQAKEEDKGAVIKVGDTELTIDADTANKLDTNTPITLLILTGKEYASGNVDKANLANQKLVLEISLEGQALNGKAKIKVPVNFEVKENEEVHVYYVDQNGNTEDMHATYSNGIVSFETTHFSTYVLTLEPTNQGGNSGENNPEEGKKNNSWIIILIVVLVVLLSAGIVLFFILKKKKGNDDKHDDSNNDNNNQNVEEQKQGVIFNEKKSLNEEYALLSKEDRKLFDLLKANVLNKENVRTTEAIDSYTAYIGKEKLVRLKIKKGDILVEFFSNDKDLKDIVGSSKESSTIVKIKSEEDLNKAIDAISYKYDALNN